jgi:hypothetical protein
MISARAAGQKQKDKAAGTGVKPEYDFQET